MRWLGAIFAVLVLIGAPAQAQEPRITATSEQEEVLVGQPYLLRVSVLVPTFMPTPPVFPSFEVPGLIVRLPERSTQPTSERIDGETWSGVTRTYRIYPMQVGVTEIPAQPISITYREAGSIEDIPLTAELPPVSITAVVPERAEGLNPLILAENVTVDQVWEMAEGELAVGDAVVRSLEVAVTGTSALFVPPLLGETPPGSVDGEEVAAFLPYPEDARVTESLERGIMSGTRSEKVSYIAQGGGTAVFPDIALSWFNLDTNEVEEIVLEGRSVSVAMPPPPPFEPDWRRLSYVLLALFVLAGALRMIWPRLERLGVHLREAYEATARAAHQEAVEAAQARDLAALIAALDLCEARGHAVDRKVREAVAALTRTRYRDGADDDGAWKDVARALRGDRPHLLVRGAAPDDLPPLNPFTKS